MKIVVIDARRTPIAKSCSKTGIFRRIRADTLSGTLLGEMWRGPLGSVCVPSAVIWGCARQHAEQGFNIARLIGEHDTRVWRVIQHYVDKAVDAKDLSKVSKIAIDETSARRGHDYVTLFADAESRRVVHVSDGKSGEAIADFVRRLERQGGDKHNITGASIDMSAAFIAGVRALLPNAEITFDRFHVMKLVNEAVDEVRRQESRRDPLLKGTRYIWLKNAENLTQDQANSWRRWKEPTSTPCRPIKSA